MQRIRNIIGLGISFCWVQTLAFAEEIKDVKPPVDLPANYFLLIAGLIIFTDKIEKFIPARKGIKNVLRVIREVLYFKPQGRSTDIAQALEFLSKVTKRKTVAFIISDFFESNIKSLKQAMAIANKRHDLIAITLNDPRERELLNCGLVALEDAESGDVRLVDTSDEQLRREYKTNAFERIKERATRPSM